MQRLKEIGLILNCTFGIYIIYIYKNNYTFGIYIIYIHQNNYTFGIYIYK